VPAPSAISTSVDAVLVEQVDAVGIQPMQASPPPLDVVGAAVQPARGGAVVTEAELGGDHDLVADAGECIADEFLVGERSVNLSGVNNVVPRSTAAWMTLMPSCSAVTEAHAAEAERGHLQAAGAEGAEIHEYSLSEGWTVIAGGEGQASRRTPRRVTMAGSRWSNAMLVSVSRPAMVAISSSVS
jgi:hypothetical protein